MRIFGLLLKNKKYLTDVKQHLKGLNFFTKFTQLPLLCGNNGVSKSMWQQWCFKIYVATMVFQNGGYLIRKRHR
jgi:hypothetical protein